ncbi:MAG: pseudouridine synthase [Kofleriaceae bacterium]
MTERLRINRFFTEHGVCSRRAADRYVEAGRVKINGALAKHGDTVGPEDRVTLDDAPIIPPDKRPVVLAYHKPPGIECTSDQRVPENIIDAVGYPERIFHVGRLDKYSEGLILLTNRGELVNQVLRARNQHEKEYVVDVDAPLAEASLRRMRAGIEILGRPTLPCRVDQLGPRTFRMVLTEGRNRQIRRMCEAEDLRVKRLVRVRVMNIELGELPRGRWRLLRPGELASLERSLAAAEQRAATDASDDQDEQ